MAIPTIYKGKKYRTLKACIQENTIEGVSYSNVISRLKIGWSMEDALTTPIPEKYKKVYVVDGVSYSTLKELGDRFGLKHDQLYARARRGWTDHEIAYGKQKRPKKNEVQERNLNRFVVTVAGVEYPSVADMCRQHEIKLVTYRKRIAAGWSVEEAIGIKERIDGRKSKGHFEVDGKSFSSVSSMANYYGISPNTVYARLRNGCSMEQAVGLSSLPSVESKKRVRKTYEYQGKSYNSLTALANDLGMNDSTLHRRINQMGLSIEDAVSYRAVSVIEYNGVEYDSVSALARAFGLQHWVVSQRLNRGYSIDDAIAKEDLRKTFSGEVSVRGIRYDSLLDACDKLNFAKETINKRLEAGASVEEAFSNDWSENPILVQGEKYKNLTAVSKRFDVSLNVLSERLSKGYSIEQAVGLIQTSFSNKGIYNEAYFRKNPEEAKIEGVLYFVSFTESETKDHFQKIGISKYSVDKRFHNYKDYTLEVINVINMPLYDAYKLEQMIIEDLEPYSYVPSDKFEGRTECYKLNLQQIADLSEIIESFK